MNILPTNHRYALLAPVLALIALLLPLALAGQPASHSPQQAVERAWGLAQDSGAYSFHTSIDQQTNAVPSLRSAGRPPRHDYLSLQGSLDQPAERMELAMWRTLGPQPPNAMQVRLADGQTLGRTDTGEWKPIEVDTASFAPGGDPLGFLAAATNVQVGASETRDFGEVSRAYSSYTFAIDGQTFASYLEQKLVPQLREQGKLPTWLTSDFQSQYKTCTAPARCGSTRMVCQRGLSSPCSCRGPRTPALCRPASPPTTARSISSGWRWPRRASAITRPAGSATASASFGHRPPRFTASRPTCWWCWGCWR